MQKSMIALTLLASFTNVSAEEYYAVRPDGQRNWQVNSMRREGGEIYQVRPDGQRDWQTGSYKQEGDKMVPYRPDGQRDWQKDTLQKRH